MKEVNLTPSDVVGSIERGVKELMIYLSNPPLSLNVDELRNHFKHMDEHLGRLKEMQLLSAASMPANANTKDPVAALRVN